MISKSKGLVLVALLMLAILIVSGCIGEEKAPDVCPVSCDDKDKCTNDYCSEATGYRCKHDPITPCCGNDKCESGEDFVSCLADCPKPPIATKEPSEMILEVSDFPEGQNWTMKERVERLKSDTSEEARELGWKKGYYVRYMRSGSEDLWEMLADYTILEQVNSIYPIENISKVMYAPTAHESTKNITYDEYSKPNIGDDSRAFRVTVKDESGDESRYYQVEFVKMGVYVSLYMSGTTTDYELLKDLARKVEKKIK